MSVDIDLSPPTSTKYVSVINSAGIYRLFTGIKEDDRITGLHLSDPLTPESLEQLSILLNNFDVEEYTELYNESIYREQSRTLDFRANILPSDWIPLK